MGVPLPWLRPRRCTIFVFAVDAHTAGRNSHSGTEDRALDGPDEAGELAGDGGNHHSRLLAFADQRPVAGGKSALRLPSDLARGTWCGGGSRQFLLAEPRRGGVAPGALHPKASRPSIAGL